MKAFTDTHRRRISESKKGVKLKKAHAAKIAASNCKRVLVYDRKGGWVYDSLKEAAGALAIPEARLCGILAGNEKLAKKWGVEYAEYI